VDLGSYKKTSDVEQRSRVVEQLSGELELQSFLTTVECSADVLDAVVCALAGLEYVCGKTVPATDTSRFADPSGPIDAGCCS
jgi:hypothetical protein